MGFPAEGRCKSSHPDSSKKNRPTGRRFCFNKEPWQIVSVRGLMSHCIYQQQNYYSTKYIMETNELISPSPINRHSIISLVLGILTVVIFCSGIMIPIPFTSLVCAPASFLLGILALLYGTISLKRIRKHNESGLPMAWMGMLSGGFIFLCILCMLVALISLFMFAPETLPPFLQNHQI